MKPLEYLDNNRHLVRHKIHQTNYKILVQLIGTTNDVVISPI